MLDTVSERTWKAETLAGVIDPSEPEPALGLVLVACGVLAGAPELGTPASGLGTAGTLTPGMPTGTVTSPAAGSADADAAGKSPAITAALDTRTVAVAMGSVRR